MKHQISSILEQLENHNSNLQFTIKAEVNSHNLEQLINALNNNTTLTSIIIESSCNPSHVLVVLNAIKNHPTIRSMKLDAALMNQELWSGLHDALIYNTTVVEVTLFNEESNSGICIPDYINKLICRNVTLHTQFDQYKKNKPTYNTKIKFNNTQDFFKDLTIDSNKKLYPPTKPLMINPIVNFSSILTTNNIFEHYDFDYNLIDSKSIFSLHKVNSNQAQIDNEESRDNEYTETINIDNRSIQSESIKTHNKLEPIENIDTIMEMEERIDALYYLQHCEINVDVELIEMSKETIPNEYLQNNLF